jgi:hypothetical protein
MDAKAIQDLVCTDQVRRGDVLGLVVGSYPARVDILWDTSGKVPTSYARNSAALKDVKIERRADRVERGGRVIGFHTRPGALESGEEPCESE